MNGLATILAALSCARVGAVAAPDPTPTPTPTPTPSAIPTLSPGASWTGTPFAAAGSGGAAPAADDINMRTLAGVGWPDYPTIAVNMEEGMTVEPQTGYANGYNLFAVLEIGHDDGFDPCTIWCEGNSVTVSPSIIGVSHDGLVQWGIGCTLKARAGMGGWAYVTVLARPKRGYEYAVTYRIWLNDNGYYTRPVFYVDPDSGSDTNNGLTKATAFQHPCYAETGQDYFAGGTVGATGARIIWTKESLNYKMDAGRAPGNVVAGWPLPAAPITHELDAGLNPQNVLCTSSSSLPSGGGYTSAKICEYWGIRFDTSTFFSWTCAGTFANGGATLFRDGCEAFDGSGGGAGPLDANGYPLGFAPNGGALPRAQRFFDADGSFTRVAAIGSAAKPVKLRMVNIAGMIAYVWAQGEYGWTGFFPAGNAKNSNFRSMNCAFKGRGNMWFRQSAATEGTVVSVAPYPVTINGATVNLYKVTTTGLSDMASKPPLTTGASYDAISQIDAAHMGQYWMHAIAQGASTVAYGGGIQWHGSLGPAYPPNRDGSLDQQWYGWSVIGQDADAIYLVSNPTGMQAGDKVRVVMAHGNDQLFIQQWSPDPTPIRNLTLYNTTIEHTEGYQLYQFRYSQAGGGTVTYDAGTNCLTFSQAQSFTCGIYVEMANGAWFIIRRKISSTVYECFQKVNDQGVMVLPNATVTSGQTFTYSPSLVSMSFINFFSFGTTAQCELAGPIQGFSGRSSALTNISLFGTAFIWYNTTRWGSYSLADCYVSRYTAVDGEPWFQTNLKPSLFCRNVQWGYVTPGNTATGENRNSIATAPGMIADRPNFGASIKGTLALAASATAWPVDIAGVTRVPGVSKVGALV